MEERRVYLDHNATTPLHPEVKEAMMAAMDAPGNPSSLHAYGREAKTILEEARGQVASLINAKPEELVFVGSGSEANNTVLCVLACASPNCSHGCGSRRGVVTTTIEHPCVLETAKCLHDRGFPVTFLDVDEHGRVDPNQLADAVTDTTKIVSIMLANNEVGTTQDIKTLAEITHAKGAMFHTDAVQAVGKIPVDVKDLNADFVTLSAHKIYGPKGVGALYTKEGVQFCPLVRGGHQERGRRAGTENTVGIVGFGKACELRAKELDAEAKRLGELKQALKAGISDRIPDVFFNGHPEHCLPTTLNVSFAGVEGEAILLYLDLEGIAVSTGSACASGSLDPSHVLLAMGMTAERAHGSIRISLGRENTMDDVNYVLEVLPGIIERTRQMSTAYSRR